MRTPSSPSARGHDGLRAGEPANAASPGSRASPDGLHGVEHRNWRPPPTSATASASRPHATSYGSLNSPSIPPRGQDLPRGRARRRLPLRRRVVDQGRPDRSAGHQRARDGHHLAHPDRAHPDSLRPPVKPKQFTSWAFTRRALESGLVPSMGSLDATTTRSSNPSGPGCRSRLRGSPPSPSATSLPTADPAPPGKLRCARLGRTGERHQWGSRFWHTRRNIPKDRDMSRRPPAPVGTGAGSSIPPFGSTPGDQGVPRTGCHQP